MATLTANTLLPSISEQDASGSSEPNIDPDSQWKYEIRRTIERELQPMVDKAREEKEEKLRGCLNDEEKERVVQDYGNTMASIRRIAQERYDFFMREREEQQASSASAESMEYSAIVREQQALLDQIRRERSVRPRYDSAITEMTIGQDGEDAAGLSGTDDSQMPVDQSQSAGLGQQPRNSRPVSGSKPFGGITAGFQKVSQVSSPSPTVAEPEERGVSRRPSAASLSKARGQEIWRPAGATDDRPATSRTFAHAAATPDIPVTPTRRDSVTSDAPRGPSRSGSVRYDARYIAEPDVEVNIGSWKEKGELEAVDQQWTTERTRDRQSQNSKIPPRLSGNDFNSRRSEDRPQMQNGTTSSGWPTQPPTPASAHLSRPGSLGGTDYFQLPTDHTGIPIRASSQMSGHRGSPEYVRQQQSGVSATRPIPHKRSLTAESEVRQPQVSPSWGSFQGPPTGQAISNVKVGMRTGSRRSFTSDDGGRQLQGSPRPRLWNGPESIPHSPRRDSTGSRSNLSRSSKQETYGRVGSDWRHLPAYDEQSVDSGESDWEDDGYGIQSLERREDEARRMTEEAQRKAAEIRKKEEEAKRREDSIRRREEEVRQREEELRGKEKDAEQREEDARRREEDARRREDDAKRKEESVRRREEDVGKREQVVRQKEEDLKRQSEEVTRREQGIRRAQEEMKRQAEEAKRQKEEMKRADQEANQRRRELQEQMGEVKQREEEVGRKEQEVLRRVEEVKRKEEDVRRREQRTSRDAEDTKRRAQEVSQKAEEIQARESEITQQAREAKRRDQEITRREEGNRSREDESKQREEELRQREERLDREQLQLQAKQDALRQSELKRREEESRLKVQREEEARLREEAKLKAQRDEELKLKAQRDEELRAQKDGEAKLRAQRDEEVKLKAQREERRRAEASRREEEERLKAQRRADTERLRAEEEDRRYSEELARQEAEQTAPQLAADGNFLREQEVLLRHAQERKRQDNFPHENGRSPATPQPSTSHSAPRNIPGRSASISSTASGDRSSTASSSVGSTSGFSFSSRSSASMSSQTSTATTAGTPKASAKSPAWKASNSSSGGSAWKAPPSSPMTTEYSPSPVQDEDEWQRRQEEYARQQQDLYRRMKEKERLAQSTKQMTKDDVIKLFEEHEGCWSRIPTMDVLSWYSFPWPVLKIPKGPEDFSLAAIDAYILSPHHPKDKTKSPKDRIKENIRKWHPDKFNVQYLSKVRDDERDRVKEGAEAVAGFLGDMLRRQSTTADLFA
ncbi:uncharacterized protein FIBRA_01414 [Fibroporia radiculosa]|uniref:J domain-containing protein n=1 Tax=Fibroporia radiculosa TaxID=599839 RepID=J4I8H0_9APHY|nr:uncharacterized protein FIBRA_01414 [Fibroporia radiculosa]CCL99396.1 predicted protein [Fibroporia radiculosa]